MGNVFKSVAIFAFITISFALAEFPDDPRPCHFGDADCLVKTINRFSHEKYTGDGSIDLISIDPFDVENMLITQGADSPVNIDLTLNNNKMHGLRTAVISKVKGFGKNISARHEIHGITPVLSLIGDYSIKGRILILPINGDGKNNITMVNLRAAIKFRGNPVTRNGETYMQIRDINLTLKPERVIFHFTNLFNGDKALGDGMNQFMNENWKEIFAEVHDSLSSSFGQMYKTAFEKVFSKYPYEKYFLPESK